MTDRQNVAQFKEVMRRAYRHQQEKGVVKGEKKSKLDKLFALDRDDRVVARDGRVLFFWRTFRRRASYQYARQKGLPWRIQLDWESLFQWIIDNWQLIVRTIIFLVPFVI